MNPTYARIAAVFACATLLMAACGAGAISSSGDEAELETLRIDDLRPIERQTGEPIHILTTTSFVHEVVSAVSGDEVHVERLLPLGVDPHAFEPTPGDLRAVADADLVVINGLGLEEFLAEMVRNAGGAGRVISLSQGVDTLSFGKASPTDEEHAGAGSPDPHIWLDPVRMTRWTENAVEALSAIDPDHAHRYVAHGEAYAQMLEELHAWILSEIDPIPPSERILVTDHEAVRYFADRYRFEVVGAIIPAYSTAAEPSAQELARLERSVRSAGARAIFVGAEINPDTAIQLAADTGLQWVPLYLGSLTGPEGPAGTYEDLMKYNVRAIVQAILNEG